MDYLQVKIQTPKEILFHGQAKAISSKNSKGNFDILPGHANFITITTPSSPIIVYIDIKKKLTFSPQVAVFYCTNNKVNVYTDMTLS